MEVYITDEVVLRWNPEVEGLRLGDMQYWIGIAIAGQRWADAARQRVDSDILAQYFFKEGWPSRVGAA